MREGTIKRFAGSTQTKLVECPEERVKLVVQRVLWASNRPIHSPARLDERGALWFTFPCVQRVICPADSGGAGSHTGVFASANGQQNQQTKQ
jgi:hypothetical protein